MNAPVIRIGEMDLEVLESPEYAIAHPEEMWAMAPHDAFAPCIHCLLAIRPDTGELVLLWGVGTNGTRTWAVSREDPEYNRHRWELEGRSRHVFNEQPLMLSPRALVA